MARKKRAATPVAAGGGRGGPPAAEADARQAENFRTVARNRRAGFDYEILERFEAGLVLTGTEIKSLRSGKGSIQEAYVRPRNGELWLVGANIALYEAGSRFNHEPTRDRKLLLHRKQVRRLTDAAEQKGLTIVPMRLYLSRGLAKLEIGLGRGKRQYEKRQNIAEREAARQVQRALRRDG